MTRALVPIIDPEPTLCAEELRAVRQKADPPLSDAERAAYNEARAIEQANADIAAIRADEAANGSTRPMSLGDLAMLDHAEAPTPVQVPTLCDDAHERQIRVWAKGIAIAVLILAGIYLCAWIVATRVSQAQQAERAQ